MVPTDVDIEYALPPLNTGWLSQTLVYSENDAVHPVSPLAIFATSTYVVLERQHKSMYLILKLSVFMVEDHLTNYS